MSDAPGEASGWPWKLNAGCSVCSSPCKVPSNRLRCVARKCAGSVSSSTAKPWFWLVMQTRPVLMSLTGWLAPWWLWAILKVVAPAADVLALQSDGVFLSNGPGDPAPCTYAIEAVRAIVDTGIPTFGICLGHQIMALASGAKTFKMKFGHHGANHPVKDLDNGRVSITSQNHGFAVDEKTLPANLRATHISLFDGTLQGLARTDKPAFCFQGHPEASPGPHDIGYLFDRFTARMEQQNA